MKKLFYSIGSAVLAVILLSTLISVGTFSYINVRLTDSLYGGLNPSNDIAIVGIDDKSLQEIGRWPWDRDIFSKVVSNLENVEVIGIDIAFFESSDNDTPLANALKKSENVILGVEYTDFELEDGIVKGKNVLKPVPEIIESAKALGYVNIPLDRDGVNRRLNIGIQGEYSSFAEEVYRQRFGRSFAYDNNMINTNFAGGPGTFMHYSISDVLNNKVEIKEKIILIGATSPDFHDEYIVPTSEGVPMSGVEVHANVINTMITRQFIIEQSVLSTILLMTLLAVISAILMLFLSLKISTIILVIGVFAYFLFAIVFFSMTNVILNIIYPPLAIILTYLLSVMLFYSTEKEEKKQAITAFSKYVSPDVVNEIIKDPTKLKLGGEKKEMTILFSDIRKFTSISEKLSPEQLVHLLNEYLTVMADLIMENKGVVDKFIGDAIMALWGVPLHDKKHAEHACDTALEMRKKLGSVQKKWEAEGIPHFEIGIGINTGEAVAGNVGSYNRFDYTAIGDNVNLGSRLEGLTKQYGVSILISEYTNNKVKEHFETRRIDLVAVKGKKDPVWVYELIGKKQGKEEHYIKDFEKGINHYLKKDWKNAIDNFEEVMKIKTDEPSKIFIARCREFMKNPPSQEWRGVFEAKNK